MRELVLLYQKKALVTSLIDMLSDENSHNLSITQKVDLFTKLLNDRKELSLLIYEKCSELQVDDFCIENNLHYIDEDDFEVLMSTKY